MNEPMQVTADEVITGLRNQRNAALDEAVQLNAAVNMLMREVEILKNELASLRATTTDDPNNSDPGKKTRQRSPNN